LLFEKSSGLLSFPVTVAKRNASQAVNEQGKTVFQGAYVYDVSLSRGFTLRGTISHYVESDYLKAGDWWYDQGKDVQRVLRLNNSLLTVSDGEIRSSSLGDLREEDSVAFPVEESNYPCGRGGPCIME